MAKFGWCLDDLHDRCWVVIARRRDVDGRQIDTMRCGCECHGDSASA